MNLPPDCPEGEFVHGFDEVTGLTKCAKPVIDTSGTITEVVAGNGLLGGGQSGAVTLSVDYAKVQARVSNTCPPGTAIRNLAEDGTATCEPVGMINSISFGAGLIGTTTNKEVTVSVDTDYLQKRVTGSCPPGSYMRSIDREGNVVCQRRNAGIVEVEAGADAAQNGLALLDAVASITDATAANPVVVRVFPGRFDLGTSTLTMKPYVSLVGTGASSVTISRRGSSTLGAAVIDAAANAEIRDLTVSCPAAADAYCTGIKVSGTGNNAALRRVVIHVSANQPVGLEMGSSSVPTVQGVEVLTEGISTSRGLLIGAVSVEIIGSRFEARAEDVATAIDMNRATVRLNKVTAKAVSNAGSATALIAREGNIDGRGIVAEVSGGSALSTSAARLLSTLSVFESASFVKNSETSEGYSVVVEGQRDSTFKSCTIKASVNVGTGHALGLSAHTGALTFHAGSIVGNVSTTFGTFKMGGAFIDGVISQGTNVVCVASYKANMTPLNSGCQ